MKRLMPRALVVLTVLVVLCVGGYAGQVWWARHKAYQTYESFANGMTMKEEEFWISYATIAWRDASWRPVHTYSPIKGHGIRWLPPRYYYEVLRLITGEDFSNDRAAYEAWFKTHSDYRWDWKRKRLTAFQP